MPTEFKVLNNEVYVLVQHEIIGKNGVCKSLHSSLYPPKGKQIAFIRYLMMRNANNELLAFYLLVISTHQILNT